MEKKISIDFLHKCLKLGCHHEQHSKCFDQEVHNRSTTSAGNRWPLMSFSMERQQHPDKSSGKTRPQEHTRCFLCIWIQNPLWWWQYNLIWLDLWFLQSWKEKLTQTQTCKTWSVWPEKKKKKSQENRKGMQEQKKLGGCH